MVHFIHTLNLEIKIHLCEKLFIIKWYLLIVHYYKSSPKVFLLNSVFI